MSDHIQPGTKPTLTSKTSDTDAFFAVHQENKRLRAALSAIAVGTPDLLPPFRVMGEAQLRAMARKALEGSSDETSELPSHQAIADQLSSMRDGSTRCPVCARTHPHEHTPEELIIYRNGVKYGRSLSGQEPAEPRCPDCGLLLDPPGHDLYCPRRTLKAFVHLCAPHGQDWLTCPECAKAAVNGNPQV